jgi:hypothetical protein
MKLENAGRRTPSLTAIGSEVARVEAMLVALTEQIDSADCKLKTSLQLQVCRAELRAYWAGLLYGLGYTNLLDTRHARPTLNLPGEDLDTDRFLEDCTRKLAPVD